MNSVATIDHRSALIVELSRYGIEITTDQIAGILRMGIDTYLERKGIELSAEALTTLHLIAYEIRQEANVKFTIA